MRIFEKLLSFFSSFQTKEKNKGFTLLELLIVIAILATLATIVVLVLNPAETLAKSRDTQRMSDMATLKSAIALYTTTVTSPDLTTDATDNDRCYVGGGTPKIFYSASVVTDADVAGGTGNAVKPTSDATASVTDGTGWVPVKLDDVTGGSPIANMPFDPVNSGTSGTSTNAAITNDALVYRYACKKSPLGFEIDAKLESVEYTSTNNKLTKDGGNNSNLYEVGTNLTILPAQGSDNF